MEYSIGEFSQLIGIGVHALRYYEKEGLIVPCRKDNHRRCYTEQDVVWMQFILRLKHTGMPIKEIRRYAQLREQGNETLEARMAMLVQHRTLLLDELAAMEDNLKKLDDKIDYYKDEILKHHEITP